MDGLIMCLNFGIGIDHFSELEKAFARVHSDLNGASVITNDRNALRKIQIEQDSRQLFLSDVPLCKSRPQRLWRDSSSNIDTSFLLSHHQPMVDLGSEDASFSIIGDPLPHNRSHERFVNFSRLGGENLFEFRVSDGSENVWLDVHRRHFH